ncbi:MAG: signal peptidase I [Pirellulales bacterium]|nr:signal peptidase I [Pirellulales bacterium]
MTEFPTEPAAAAGGGIMGMCCFVLEIAILIVVIIGLWKTFQKAGKPGWASIIPFYNMYVLTEIAGRPILWFILMLIPCVNIIAHIVVSIDVAKNFGKDTLYGVGLILFPFIFYPLLGFGDAKYQPVQHGP